MDEKEDGPLNIVVFISWKCNNVLLDCIWPQKLLIAQIDIVKMKRASWSQNHLRDPVRRVGQVFDVKLVLPVKDSKAGPKADPFAVPFDVSENVSQSCYGSDKQTIVPENVSQDKQTIENVSQDLSYKQTIENVSQDLSYKQTIENVSQNKQTVENVSQTKCLLLNAGDKILGAGRAVAHLLEVHHPSHCKKGSANSYSLLNCQMQMQIIFGVKCKPVWLCRVLPSPGCFRQDTNSHLLKYIFLGGVILLLIFTVGGGMLLRSSVDSSTLTRPWCWFSIGIDPHILKEIKIVIFSEDCHLQVLFNRRFCKEDCVEN